MTEKVGRDYKSEIEKISSRAKLEAVTLTVLGLVSGIVANRYLFDEPIMPTESEPAMIYDMAERSNSQIQYMLDSPFFSDSEGVLIPGREELLAAGRKIGDFVDTSEFREDARSYQVAFNGYQENNSNWINHTSYFPVGCAGIGGVIGLGLACIGQRKINRLRKEEKLSLLKTD